MRRSALSAGILLLIGSSALGQSYDMTVHLSSGEAITIPIDEILRIEFAGVSTGVEDPVNPAADARRFLLLSSRPNPFHSSTSIEYEIPAAAEVSVRIFDVRGALVTELLHEAQSAGLHRVIWDGSDDHGPVAAGMYLYKVDCGGVTLAKRLVLLR